MPRISDIAYGASGAGLTAGGAILGTTLLGPIAGAVGGVTGLAFVGVAKGVHMLGDKYEWKTSTRVTVYGVAAALVGTTAVVSIFALGLISAPFLGIGIGIAAGLGLTIVVLSRVVAYMERKDAEQKSKLS